MADKEAIVKNVLVILFSKTSLLPEEKRLFADLCRELGVTPDEHLRWNTEWRANPQSPLVRRDAAADRESLSFMLAAAFFDNRVYSGERAALLRFCREAGLASGPVQRCVDKPGAYDFAAGVVEEARGIAGDLAADSGAGVREAAPLTGYVATQVSREGIDELQALSVCARLGLNVALSGPPGIGKTESVRELAKLLELPLFTKVCSSCTSESHVIAHPVLIERNGATVTAQEDGALCRAMLAPGIFYGDEYNLLKEDVQKRMNSAFDDRRSIDRNDGSLVTAKPGFLAVISYNPSRDIGRRDLEDSVADRFVHFKFLDWPSELKAFIATLRSEERFGREPPRFADFGVRLETRAFDRDGGFLVQDGGAWLDCLTGAPKPRAAPAYRYLCRAVRPRDADSARAAAALDAAAFKSTKDLALAYSSLTDTVNELAATGKSPILKSIGLGDKTEADDWETMYVHRCSTRIVSAALSHYAWFRDRGWGAYAAQAYGARLILDQMAYGAFAEQRLRNVANPQILESIAKALKLLANDTVYTTAGQQ
jgi:MoxR-like ATPase